MTSAVQIQTQNFERTPNQEAVRILFKLVNEKEECSEVHYVEDDYELDFLSALHKNEDLVATPF